VWLLQRQMCRLQRNSPPPPTPPCISPVVLVKVKQFDVYKTICKVDVLSLGGTKGFGVGLNVLL